MALGSDSFDTFAVGKPSERAERRIGSITTLLLALILPIWSNSQVACPQLGSCSQLGAALAHREGAPHTHSLGSGNGRGRDYVRSLTMSSFRWVTTSSLFTTLCPICTFPSPECAGGSLYWQLVSTAGFLRTGWLIPHSARSEHMSRKSCRRQHSGGYCWSGSVIMQRCWGLHHTCTIWDTNHHLPDVKKGSVWPGP